MRAPSLLTPPRTKWVYSVLTGPLAHVPGPWYTKWTRYVSVFQTIRAQHPAWVHRLHEQYGMSISTQSKEALIP